MHLLASLRSIYCTSQILNRRKIDEVIQDRSRGTEVRLRSNRHAKTFELQNHHVMSGWGPLKF
jgi:hypothetical protein